MDPLRPVILIIIIALFSVGKAVVDAGGLDGAAGVQGANLENGFFHPKIMGLLVILFIAFFTIQRLAAKEG